MKALIIGIRFEEIDFDKDDAVAKVMKDFDTSQDERVDLTEFHDGITKWLNEAMRAGESAPEAGPRTFKFLNDFHLVRPENIWPLFCKSKSETS